jgi:2-keto-3-deoxy-L-rhamnonate aldolase RhmA
VRPLVRVPAASLGDVDLVLDAGAAGILFPQISTGDEAEVAGRALRYPPNGTRGWGGRHIRRVRWHGSVDMHTVEYLREVEASLTNVLMIESPEGVEAVEEILERGEPDYVIFGLADHAVAVGFDEDATAAAAARVYAACREREVALGLIPGSPSAELRPGDFCVAGVDSLLADGAIAGRVAELRG